MSFVKTELDKLQRLLSSECDLNGGDQDPGEEELASSSKHAFLKITVDFLRIMKQEQLAENVLSSKAFENHVTQSSGCSKKIDFNLMLLHFFSRNKIDKH